MTRKDSYSHLCSIERSIPIFSCDWWLDAVVGYNKWDVALVERGGKVVAALPYSIEKRMGFTRVGQPVLTQKLGPWIAPIKGSHSAVLSEQKKLMECLIDQLPRFDYFVQCWDHSVTNWLPFKWRGFEQTTRYTYLVPIDDCYDPMSSFSPNMRNKVRKAEKLVQVQHDLPVDAFYSMNVKTFSRQGLKVPYSVSCLRRIDAALVQRRQRKIFFAVDAQNAIHSALYLIWDGRSAYVHLVGEDPQLRNSGAGIFLIKAAMDFAITKGLSVFDFEGSMIESVEVVRRSCGGIQTPYFQVSKTCSRLVRMRRCLMSLAGVR